MRAVLATHEVGSVPVQVLRDYLVPRTEALLFCHHPLQYQGMARGRRSYAETYGCIATRRLLPAAPPVGIEPLSYVKDLLLTLIWTVQCRVRFDLFVGAGNLNAFAGLLLCRVGIVRRVVYYAIDYHPRRFESPVLQAIYRAVESACVRGCDATWNVSEAMRTARRADGLSSARPQLVVPIGAHVRPLPAPDPAARRRIVFMGNLLPSHGLDLVIRALPEVLASAPDAYLDVFGEGPHGTALQELAEAVGVRRAVTFHGYVESHEALDLALARGGVAVATYDPSLATFTRFADPGKVKSYLAAGLPIVMTGVPPIAAELDGSCAVVIPYDVGACAAALVRLLQDDALADRMRAAARARAADLDWDVIFARALAETLGQSVTA